MGWQETSVPFHTEPTRLNRDYRTPNMERLAADGPRKTNADMPVDKATNQPVPFPDATLP